MPSVLSAPLTVRFLPDEVDFDNEYMDEARRYYCNIVGKYGSQVQSLLKKAHGLDLKMFVRCTVLLGEEFRRLL